MKFIGKPLNNTFTLACFVVIHLFTGCKNSTDFHISDPDYAFSDNESIGIISDHVSLSGMYSVYVTKDSPYGLEKKVSVKSGELYEAYMFRYKSSSLIKLAVGGDWGFYQDANWGYESIGDWEKISIQVKIPDSISSGVLTFFSFNTGPFDGYVDSLVVQKLPEFEAMGKKYLLHPLLYEISNHSVLKEKKAIYVDSISYYTDKKQVKEVLDLHSIEVDQFKSMIEYYMNDTSISLLEEIKQYAQKLSYPAVSFSWNEEVEIKPISGYSDKIIYNENDPIDLHIETDLSKYSLSVSSLRNSTNTFIDVQEADGPLIYIKPNILPVGCFVAHLRKDSFDFKIPLIVNEAIDKPEVIILAPITTWHAYNSYGGKSLYRNTIDSSNVYYISTKRPLSSVYFEHVPLKHDFLILENIYSWFSSRYPTKIYPDYYLESNPEVFEGVKTVVLAQHCEYFSPKMFSSIESIAQQANIISMGGNQIYWKIKWHDDFSIIECRKDGTFFDNTNIPGGLWRNGLYSEAAFLGTAYTDAGASTYAPYKVTAPNHWLYNNIPVSDSSIFGTAGIDGLGICGDETDKPYIGTPSTIEILAKGENSSNGGGYLTLIDRNNYATLSCGSISCGSGLDRDSVFTQIIQNFMDVYH